MLLRKMITIRIVNILTEVAYINKFHSLVTALCSLI